MNTLTFTKAPGYDGIYYVHDVMSQQLTIGRVARINGRQWVALTPGHSGSFDGQRKYDNRQQAAHALSRFTDTGDRAWIEEK